MQAMPIVSFDDVSFCPDPDSPNAEDAPMQILEGIDVRIEPGEFICVAGRNGSGKTTFTKLMIGLISPTKGSVSLLHRDLAQLDERELLDLRSKTGYVLQNPDAQMVCSKVFDEVAFGPQNLGIDREEVISRANRALETCGLAARSESVISTLSGGLRQRVAIASALAMEPELLVLDEPTSMLDEASRQAVWEILSAANENGTTVVMVTHSPEEMSRSSRLLVFSKGRVAFDGAPAEYLGTDPLPRIPNTVSRSASKGMEASSRSEEPSSPIASEEAPESDPPLLQMEGVSFAYEPSAGPGMLAGEGDSEISAPVLQDVSLSIFEGQSASIQGDNGSGKSTLLRLLNGLLRPSSGEIRICGNDISKRRERGQARFEIGVVFQNPERQLFASSVIEDVSFGPKNMGLSRKEAYQRAEEALRLLDMDPGTFASRNPFALSGGEMRKVAIAGVLAMSPKVMALDEPCVGLDLHAACELIELMRKIQDQGTAILLVSHSQPERDALCDRHLVLENGHLREV